MGTFGQSCRSPGTENPADAGFLVGDYQPKAQRLPRDNRCFFLLIFLLVDFPAGVSFVQYFQGGLRRVSPRTLHYVTGFGAVHRSIMPHTTHATSSHHKKTHHDHDYEKKQWKDPPEAGPRHCMPPGPRICLGNSLIFSERGRGGDKVNQDQIKPSCISCHYLHNLLLYYQGNFNSSSA